MRIGMIGLDTSHSEIFTSLLNDRSATHLVPGGLITHAMPIYSEDLPISFERYPKYRDIVERRYDVIIVTEVDVLMDNVDAVIIGTVDGRNHLHWFKKVVSYKKPVFIDKPIAMSDREVEQIIELAKRYNTPVMSSSSLRFADSVERLKNLGMEKFESGYFYGPLPMQKAMPGYFWYGVHTIELIVSLLGGNLQVMHREKTERFETLRLLRNGTEELLVRGDYSWHDRFGGILHFGNRTEAFQLWNDERPYYANLLEEMIGFFQTGETKVPLEETAKIVRLIEEINGMGVSSNQCKNR